MLIEWRQAASVRAPYPGTRRSAECRILVHVRESGELSGECLRSPAPRSHRLPITFSEVPVRECRTLMSIADVAA